MDDRYTAKLLAAVPQAPPFRFIDEIVELGDAHIVGRHRFDRSADFYRGHFPGDPITPGVILIEAMAQTGVVALGLHLSSAVGANTAPVLRTLFTEADVEFTAMVRPGETVTTSARVVFFRRGKLKVDARMTLDDDTLVCSGTLAGVGVPTR